MQTHSPHGSQRPRPRRARGWQSGLIALTMVFALPATAGHTAAEEATDHQVHFDDYFSCYSAVVDQVQRIERMRAGVAAAAKPGATQDDDIAKAGLACDQTVNRFNAAAGYLRAKGDALANPYLAFLLSGIHLEEQASCATALDPGGIGAYESALTAYENEDFATAFAAFERLAALGHYKAQAKLGVMYSKGLGTRQDLNTAARWWMKAGKRGFVDAQFNLAAAFNAGNGVPANPARAAQWFQMAALQGDVQAMQMTAVFAYSQKQFVAAHAWLSLGEILSKGDARKVFAQNRTGLEQQMTPEQLTEAATRARDIEAQIMLGLGATDASTPACPAD